MFNKPTQKTRMFPIADNSVTQYLCYTLRNRISVRKMIAVIDDLICYKAIHYPLKFRQRATRGCYEIHKNGPVMSIVTTSYMTVFIKMFQGSECPAGISAKFEISLFPIIESASNLIFQCPTVLDCWCSPVI